LPDWKTALGQKLSPKPLFSSAYSPDVCQLTDKTSSAFHTTRTRLGFTALGDGSGTTLHLAYSAGTDRTYLQSKVADAQGHTFEVGLTGNLLGDLGAANFEFASAPEIELLGSSPTHLALSA
jgi:hypothetical protein